MATDRTPSAVLPSSVKTPSSKLSVVPLKCAVPEAVNPCRLVPSGNAMPDHRNRRRASAISVCSWPSSLRPSSIVAFPLNFSTRGNELSVSPTGTAAPVSVAAGFALSSAKRTVSLRNSNEPKLDMAPVLALAANRACTLSMVSPPSDGGSVILPSRKRTVLTCVPAKRLAMRSACVSCEAGADGAGFLEHDLRVVQPQCVDADATAEQGGKIERERGVVAHNRLDRRKPRRVAQLEAAFDRDIGEVVDGERSGKHHFAARPIRQRRDRAPLELGRVAGKPREDRDGGKDENGKAEQKPFPVELAWLHAHLFRPFRGRLELGPVPPFRCKLIPRIFSRGGPKWRERRGGFSRLIKTYRARRSAVRQPLGAWRERRRACFPR